MEHWTQDQVSVVRSGRWIGLASSSTGTNLKVGGTRPDKFFVVVPLHFFGSTSTISRFGERFCDGIVV